LETTGTRSRSAPCPRCEGEVPLQGRPLIGEVLGCERCGAQLEVAGLEPVALEPFAKVDVDEDDLE
jgi:alpha-aminoadipate carrier protein LysW